MPSLPGWTGLCGGNYALNGALATETTREGISIARAINSELVALDKRPKLMGLGRGSVPRQRQPARWSRLAGSGGLHRGVDQQALASELSVAIKPNPRHDHRSEHDALMKGGGKECSDGPRYGAH
jgi:hypothetical protein